MKYSEKIIKQAKKMFMQNLSLDVITKHLKDTYRKACKSLHRSTVQTWIKRFDWEVERSEIVKKGLVKKTIGKIEESDKPDNALIEYHAESYKIDSDLRKIVYEKLLLYFQYTECTVLNINRFIDVYRISTVNIVKLFELTKKDDDDILLDDLLKIRGVIKNNEQKN
jgi:replication initiation and membrane attachment protein DnaB